MQKCFLVSNKATKVKEYLEHRSVIEVIEEHRSLTELDLEHLGIIDIDKFIYIYYGSDDGDVGFRSDLSVLRNLLSSAFFNADEGIFILVDCVNPMLEDFIHSACRDSNFVGTKLDIVHHSGALTLSEVSKYISGSATGSQTVSSYKAVYVTEQDSEERDRFANDPDRLDSVLPVLNDQYAMYSQRAKVEAIGSAREVTDPITRPQVLRDFTKREQPTIRQWTAFLLSGEPYSKFEMGVQYLLDYYERVGYRCVIVDITDTASVQLDTLGMHTIGVADIAVRTQFTERAGYLKCRFNQLGYVVEMLDNIGGVNVYIFLCESKDYAGMQYFLGPLCELFYSDYVTHFTESAVKDYLSSKQSSTTLFLSRAVMYEQFNLQAYRENFKGTRVAAFNLEDVDTTDFYECATGGQHG